MLKVPPRLPSVLVSAWNIDDLSYPTRTGVNDIKLITYLGRLAARLPSAVLAAIQKHH
jgi:hypothetical protein